MHILARETRKFESGSLYGDPLLSDFHVSPTRIISNVFDLAIGTPSLNSNPWEKLLSFWGPAYVYVSCYFYRERYQPFSQPVHPLKIRSKGRPLLGNRHQKAWSLSQPGDFHGFHVPVNRLPWNKEIFLKSATWNGSLGRVRLEFRPDVWYSYHDLVKFYGKCTHVNLKHMDVMGQG